MAIRLDSLSTLCVFRFKVFLDSCRARVEPIPKKFIAEGMCGGVILDVLEASDLIFARCLKNENFARDKKLDPE